MTDILIFSLVWCFILDISGFWSEASRIVMKMLTKGVVDRPFEMKPFSCSLCMTFWTGLVYIIATGFTFPMLLWVCFCAWLTTIWPAIINFVRDFVEELVYEARGWFHLN